MLAREPERGVCSAGAQHLDDCRGMNSALRRLIGACPSPGTAIFFQARAHEILHSMHWPRLLRPRTAALRPLWLRPGSNCVCRAAVACLNIPLCQHKGALPRPLARLKVGRAVPSAPPDGTKACVFRTFPDDLGAADTYIEKSVNSAVIFCADREAARWDSAPNPQWCRLRRPGDRAPYRPADV